MLHLDTYFLFFIILLATITISYVVGNLSLYILKINIINSYVSVFTKLIIGTTLLTITTAIYYTKGLTIFILFIPIIIIFSLLYYNYNYNNNKHPLFFNKIEVKPLFITLIVSFIVFSWRFGQLYNPYSEVLLSPHSDWVFYANCTDFMMYFGKENSSLDYIHGPNLGNSPYHYFNLWLTAFIIHLFSSNTLQSMVLITYTLGIVLFFLGTIMFLSLFKKTDISDVILCFLLTYITGIGFELLTQIKIFNFLFVYVQNLYTYPKFIPVYLFSIIAFYFFYKKQFFEAVLILICVTIVSIGTIVSLFPAIVIWQIFNYILNKKYDYRITLSYTIAGLIVFVFYKFVTVQTITHVSTNFADIFDKLTEFKYYKTAFNIVVGSTLQFIILYIPFTFYIFFNNSLKKKISSIIKSDLFIIVLATYIFSLLSWAILHYKTTSTQLFAKISVAWCNIIATLSIIYFWRFQNKNLKFIILTTLIFLISIYNSTNLYRFKYEQSEEYLTQVLRVNKNLSQIGAFILDKSDYNFSFSYISNLAILGNYLSIMPKKTFPLSLSPYSYEYSTDSFHTKLEQEGIKNTPFFIYTENLKENGNFTSIEDAQIKFLNEFKVNYLICTKNVVLPSKIIEKIKKEIIDPKTGERFILLK
jgi:hypothetical protein